MKESVVHHVVVLATEFHRKKNTEKQVTWMHRGEQSAHIGRFAQVASACCVVAAAGSTGLVILLLDDQRRLLVRPAGRRLLNAARLLLLNQDGLRRRWDDRRKLGGSWLLHLNAGIFEGLFLQCLAYL